MRGAGRIEYANTLRGWAAVCVLAQHYFAVYWLSPPAVGDLLHVPPDKPAVPVLAHWLTFSPHFDFGAFGVALFFLVSGFVIPFSLKNAGFLSFLVARFFRSMP